MNTSSLLSSMLMASLLVFYACPSYACGNLFQCVGKSIVKLADAGADVATLGEHGRQRDKERAEREKEAAAREAALRQAEKEKLIQEKSQTLATLDVLLTGQVASLQMTDNLLGIHDQVLAQVGTILDERKKANQLVEYARNSLRSETSDTTALLSELAKIQPPSSQNLRDGSGFKEVSTQRALKIVNDFLAAQNARKMSLDEYLAESLKSINSAALMALTKLSFNARQQALAIRGQLHSDLRATADARNGKAAELKALGVATSALPEAVAMLLKVSPTGANADSAQVSVSALLRGAELEKALSSAQWLHATIPSGKARDSLSVQEICQLQFSTVKLKTVAAPC